jgi:hypothetical protein
VQTRTWQVTADVVFPNHLAVEIDVAGLPRPPQQLTPQSRIPCGRRQIGGADAFVYEVDKQTAPPWVRDDLRLSLGRIAVRLDSAAPDPFAAIEEAISILDCLLESISFQMQVSLQIRGAYAIDLSGSPAVGEDREFGQWSGLTLPTFRPTYIPTESLSGRLVPDLDLDLDPSDQRANRALDWYRKALVAPYEADHFIFLWIACEVLAADSDLKVSGPYRGPCGHEIEACPHPDCGAPTVRPIQGPSMKRWLVDGFGVSADIADLAWKTRQMLHGADAFSSGVVDRLPELNQWLRHVVVLELKSRFGMPTNEPPIATPVGLAISPHVGVSGTRKVTQEHLTPIVEA